jgi:hypothetical protein
VQRCRLHQRIHHGVSAPGVGLHCEHEIELLVLALRRHGMAMHGVEAVSVHGILQRQGRDLSDLQDQDVRRAARRFARPSGARQIAPYCAQRRIDARRQRRFQVALELLRLQ